MARKRKGSSASDGPVRQWVATHRDGIRRLLVRWALGALVLGAMVGGGLMLADYTCDYVHHMDRFEARLADMKHDPPPYWIRDRFLDEVKTLGGLPDRFCVLDGHTVRRLVEALRLHPWVRHVQWVRARHPNRLEAKVEYRWPVALVQVRGGGTLVDRHGVVLRAERDFPLAERAKCFWITGVTMPPPSTPGRTWDDPGVQAACELAQVLRACKDRLALTVIDVANHQGRRDLRDSEIVLWTSNRTRVNWGRAPNTDKPGEVPVQEKLARLVQYAQKYGSLDGRYDLDVSHWDSIGLLPRQYVATHTLYQPK